MLNKIKCCLEFLSKHNKIILKEEGVYEIWRDMGLCAPKDVECQDDYYLIIDFNKNIIKWWSALESFPGAKDYPASWFSQKNGILPIEAILEMETSVAKAMQKIK